MTVPAILDPKRVLICDIETYKNFFLIAFKRKSDGKIRWFEHSHRRSFQVETVQSILLQNTIVTYNGMSYDMPVMYYAFKAIADDLATANRKIKAASDQIIQGNVRYWDAEALLDITIPRRIKHIDLIEPQPNAFASLKALNGRLHGRRMQDLPYEHDAVLTDEQMDAVISYCCNDLDATEITFDALADPLQMRVAIGEEYGLDFLSKSDAQMGEGMIKKRVETLTKQRVTKVQTPAGTTFPYKMPPWLAFDHPSLQKIHRKLQESEFTVKANGKVAAPPWLEHCEITIGPSTYVMGIGGLHSTEKNRSIHSDDEYVLLDFDVASYYPAIILNAGLYPRSLGKAFIDVYRQIRDDRVAAKRAGDKTRDKGLKIALNGCFGKLGSPWSILYAPHLMIAITLGGQLGLLMLIDRAHKAGIEVVSGNTDGVVFRCPRSKAGEIVKSRMVGGELADIIDKWEAETGFELEATEYTSLYNSSVNSYIAFKPDGTPKVKGPGWTGRHEGDLRTQLMKNPAAEIVMLAVIALIRDGTPIEETIRNGRDIRDYVTVVKVDGGALWRGEYLGKVVRYVWAKGGSEIIRKKGHWKTGTQGKVSKTDGCRPMMELPDTFPSDLDYDRYIAEAREVLMNYGYMDRPPLIPKLHITNANVWYVAAAIG